MKWYSSLQVALWQACHELHAQHSTATLSTPTLTSWCRCLTQPASHASGVTLCSGGSPLEREILSTYKLRGIHPLLIHVLCTFVPSCLPLDYVCGAILKSSILLHHPHSCGFALLTSSFCPPIACALMASKQHVWLINFVGALPCWLFYICGSMVQGTPSSHGSTGGRCCLATSACGKRGERKVWYGQPAHELTGTTFPHVLARTTDELEQQLALTAC
jgi:hypothetical protein